MRRDTDSNVGSPDGTVQPLGGQLITRSRRYQALGAVPRSVPIAAIIILWTQARAINAAGVNNADFVACPAVFVVEAKVSANTVALRKPWRAPAKRKSLRYDWLRTAVKCSIDRIRRFLRHQLCRNARW